MDRKFQVTVNEHQLKLIADCLEDICRFMSGQMELWHATSNLDNYRQLADKLEELKPLVTPELDRIASYGWTGGNCPNERQRKLIAETYYLYRTMLYHLYKDADYWNVYTSPALRCKDSGEEIKIKEICQEC